MIESNNTRRALISIAEQSLRAYGDDLTREAATALLPMWRHVEALDDDMRVEVLGRFRLDEELLIPFVHFLPEVQADAAVLVERVVPKRPPWSAYDRCPKCKAFAGEQCVYTRDFLGAGAGSPRQIAHTNRPLVEVTGPACADCGHVERLHSRLHCSGDIARCGCWAFRTGEVKP